MAASLLGAVLIAGAITRDGGLSRPHAVDDAARSRPAGRARVGRRGPGRPAADQRDPVGLAAHRAPAGRAGTALPPLRRRDPRRATASSASTTSPGGWSRCRPTRRARGRSSRRSASCSMPTGWRSGCRPTSTRNRGWSSPPRTGRSGTTAPATRTTSSAAGPWPRPTGPVLVSLARADREEAEALARRGVSDLLGAAVMTAAGEPGYLEVCDRRSQVVSFGDNDRAALDSMLTHVNAAIRQQHLLSPDPLRRRPRPADRAAQPAAAGGGDRPGAVARPGRCAGRAHPGGAGQLHRGHRHARARRQRRAAARHRRPAARARPAAGAAGPHGG